MTHIAIGTEYSNVIVACPRLLFCHQWDLRRVLRRTLVSFRSMLNEFDGVLIVFGDNGGDAHGKAMDD